MGRHYGPWLGVSGGGLLALAAGWTLHPELLRHVWAQLELAAGANTVLRGVMRAGAPTVGILGGGLIAALVYLALGPAERLIIARVRRRLGARREEREPELMDETSTDGITDPRYIVPKKS